MGSGGGDGGAVELQREQLAKQKREMAAEASRKEIMASQQAGALMRQDTAVATPTVGAGISLAQLMKQQIMQNLEPIEQTLTSNQNDLTGV